MKKTKPQQFCNACIDAFSDSVTQKHQEERGKHLSKTMKKVGGSTNHLTSNYMHCLGKEIQISNFSCLPTSADCKRHIIWEQSTPG